MKHLKQLRRTIRRINPEFLFLALLTLLLLAVALLWSNHSYWAILPLSVAVGMVLVVMWDNRPEPPRYEANEPRKPDQKTYYSQRTEGRLDRTIDPENLKKLRK